MSITYHVSRWSDLYENNRSRTVSHLGWVPIPNKHDGEKYSRIITRENGAELFAAWILILQVASRCQPRGSLVRVDGTPYDAEALSIKTRAPESWFKSALVYLTEIGWLDEERHEQLELAPCRQSTASLSDSGLPLSYQTTALKGREGKEGNGTHGARRADVSVRPKLEQWLAYGSTFEPTWPKADADQAFDHYEANGWTQGRGKKIKDWQAALRTCVRNWRDRGGMSFGAAARGAAPPSPPRPDIYTAPLGWRDKAKAKWPEADIPDDWLQLSPALRGDLLALK